MDPFDRSESEEDARTAVADILVAISSGRCSGEKLEKVVKLLDQAAKVAWGDTRIRTKEVSA